MHQKQVRILKKLEKGNGKKFSELGKGFDFDDKFPYHLKHLIKNKLVQKIDNLYLITNKGLLEALKFDSLGFESLALRSSIISIICEESGRYLIHNKTNKTQTYHYFPQGKMLYGESIEDACKRVLSKEINYSGEFKYEYFSTHIKRIYKLDNSLLLDNVCLFFKVILENKIKEESIGSANQFLSKQEIRLLPNVYPEIEIILFSKIPRDFYEYNFTFDYI